ncbi:hypothetical protein [Xanthobacter wiegelii]|uniref:hypothetical protein n=1 Tax=Xanthobacter wiegelii TaxID=3119913 RepID=UPI003729909D
MYQATSEYLARDNRRIRGPKTGRGAMARAFLARRAVACGLAVGAVIVGADLIDWAEASRRVGMQTEASISVDQVFGGGRKM